MQLYNKLSSGERSQLIDEMNLERITLSFYTYAKIDDPQQFRDELFIRFNELDVLGRIYVAHEGINAQLSLPEKNIDLFREFLYSYSFMNSMRLNIAVEHDNKSFLKLKIKVRSKILADGLNDNTFDVTNKGMHLKAKDFNRMLENENSIVVDMRNFYESEIGHFEKAIKPDVTTFRESLPIIEEQLSAYKEDKNILMYCTGGIRCEKASAYFKHKGFKNVYQLEGGIIEYARQIKAEGIESKFIGKNFVFDNRLGESITDDVIAKCHQCGTACDTHVNCKNDGCHLLFIQCEKCAGKMKGCCCDACMSIVMLSDEEQKILRKGIRNDVMIFRKGKKVESLGFSGL